MLAPSAKLPAEQDGRRFEAELGACNVKLHSTEANALWNGRRPFSFNRLQTVLAGLRTRGLSLGERYRLLNLWCQAAMDPEVVAATPRLGPGHDRAEEVARALGISPLTTTVPAAAARQGRSLDRDPSGGLAAEDDARDGGLHAELSFLRDEYVWYMGLLEPSLGAGKAPSLPVVTKSIFWLLKSHPAFQISLSVAPGDDWVVLSEAGRPHEHELQFDLCLAGEVRVTCEREECESPTLKPGEARVTASGHVHRILGRRDAVKLCALIAKDDPILGQALRDSVGERCRTLTWRS